MVKDIGKPIFDLFLVVASAIGFYMATTLPAVSMAGGLPRYFSKVDLWFDFCMCGALLNT